MYFTLKMTKMAILVKSQQDNDYHR